MTRRQPANPLGALIPAILLRVEREHRAIAQVQGLWRKIAGPELASHSRPVSLRRGRLVVAVDDPGEHYTLSFERARIVDALRAATEGKVTELVIRPSGPKDSKGK